MLDFVSLLIASMQIKKPPKEKLICNERSRYSITSSIPARLIPKSLVNASPYRAPGHPYLLRKNEKNEEQLLQLLGHRSVYMNYSLKSLCICKVRHFPFRLFLQLKYFFLSKMKSKRWGIIHVLISLSWHNNWFTPFYRAGKSHPIELWFIFLN